MNKIYTRLNLLPKIDGNWTYEGDILRSNKIALRTTEKNITIEQMILIAKELGYRLWVEWGSNWEWYVRDDKNLNAIYGHHKDQHSAFRAGLNQIIITEYDKHYPDAIKRMGQGKRDLYSGIRRNRKEN